MYIYIYVYIYVYIYNIKDVNIYILYNNIFLNRIRAGASAPARAAVRGRVRGLDCLTCALTVLYVP